MPDFNPQPLDINGIVMAQQRQRDIAADRDERSRAAVIRRSEMALANIAAAGSAGLGFDEAYAANGNDLKQEQYPFAKAIHKRNLQQFKDGEKERQGKTGEKADALAGLQFDALKTDEGSVERQSLDDRLGLALEGLDPEAAGRFSNRIDAGASMLGREEGLIAAGNTPEDLGKEALERRQDKFNFAQAGRAEFVKNGADILNSGEMDRKKLYGIVVEQFGEQNVASIMGQMDVKAAAARADAAAVTGGQQDLIQFYMDDGADKAKAFLAAKQEPKAFKDTLTGMYIRGSPTGAKEAKASSNKQMISSVAILRSLAENVAASGKGGLFSGTMADLEASIGPESPPELTAYIVGVQWSVTSIAYALSGAQYAEEFLDRIQKLVPTFAEMQVVDGKFAPSMVSRLKTLAMIIEQAHLSLMDNSDRAAGREAIDAFRNQVLAESREQEFYDSVIGKRDPDGAGALEDLYEKSGVNR